MSYPAYTQLEEISTENKVEVTTPQETQPSPLEVCMMRRAARWTISLCLLQLGVSIIALLSGGLLFMIIGSIFVAIGIVGVGKRRPRLLVAHFVFSLALYILTLIAIIVMIVYCVDCTFWTYFLGFIALIFQAVGMRHTRILINLMKKYPNYCAFKCASRCNSNVNACQQPTEVATQTPAEPVAVQQQQQFFVPMPVPQQYAQQPMRYPMMTPQGVPMMPMGMQPYYAFPAPVAPAPPQEGQPQPQPQPQQPQLQNMYPAVPFVYRQV